MEPEFLIRDMNASIFKDEFDVPGVYLFCFKERYVKSI
jgi:hypothetical protein